MCILCSKLCCSWQWFVRKYATICCTEETDVRYNCVVIFVFGGPGSGKTEQCEWIAKRYGFEHIHTGNLLRQEATLGTELGRWIGSALNEGKPVPTDIILELIKREIHKKSLTYNGFLLDGFPADLRQAQIFEREVCKVRAAIIFDVTDQTMMERLKKRHEITKRPQDEEINVFKRIQRYHVHQQPLIEHYLMREKVHAINGEGTKEEVFNRVKQKMKSLK